MRAVASPTFRGTATATRINSECSSGACRAASTTSRSSFYGYVAFSFSLLSAQLHITACAGPYTTASSACSGTRGIITDIASSLGYLGVNTSDSLDAGYWTVIVSLTQLFYCCFSRRYLTQVAFCDTFTLHV
ncbi:hypothetical protein ISCGN_028073 [Ixodes scapularis]